MCSPTAKMAGVLTSMALDLGNVSQEGKRSVPRGSRRGLAPQGGRALDAMSAQMAADGANMVDNGHKCYRAEREGGQNKAAGGEAAGVSALRPQPEAESPPRSEDETSDGTITTNGHYSLPKIHRSKRQCVRERDLAWESAQEGILVSVCTLVLRTLPHLILLHAL